MAGFAAGDPTADTSAFTTTPGQQELVIPLQRIPELFSSSAAGPNSPRERTRGPVVSLSNAELVHLTAALKPLGGAMSPIVKQSARADNNGALIVLQPSLPPNTKGASMLVPIGHYATGDDAAAAGTSAGATSAGGATPRTIQRILELRDNKTQGFFGVGDASVRLMAGLDQVLPPAARFQVVWSRGGANPLTIWSVVPPTNDFVALGMVATASGAGQRPPHDIIRCVPKVWTRRTTSTELVYDGAEGSVWLSKHGLLHASKGRTAPAVFELVREENGLAA